MDCVHYAPSSHKHKGVTIMANVYISENLIKAEKQELNKYKLEYAFCTDAARKAYLAGWIPAREAKIAKLEAIRLEQEGQAIKREKDAKHSANMAKVQAAFAAIGL